MPNLNTVIEKAANDLAQAILTAVRASSLQELLAMQTTTPAPRRGRPPKASKPGPKPKKKPGRKPGRPPKLVAKKATKKVAKKVKAAKPAKRKNKIAWPQCKHKGCKKNAWARGNGYCGKHFKASKAG